MFQTMKLQQLAEVVQHFVTRRTKNMPQIPKRVVPLMGLCEPVEGVHGSWCVEKEDARVVPTTISI